MSKNILIKTPLRISLLGGGTDFESFYKQKIGNVISFTIDKYIYIFLKELKNYFDETYRLNYFITERVNTIEEITNDITRESLIIHKNKKKLYISTIADIPQSSGLGSSSSFAVGLNLALRILEKKSISKENIVNDAIIIELKKLRKPIGIQDQVATGYGGLNYIKFSSEYKNNFQVYPIKSKEMSKKLSENMLLVWTGKVRQADVILKDQESKKKQNTHQLEKLADITLKYYNELRHSDFEIDLKILANLLNESWNIKKKLSNLISNKKFDDIYNLALKNGALGGKLLGAGGGGFFLFIVEKKEKEKFKQKMQGFIIEEFSIEFNGATAVHQNF